ncbi:MAG: hypothetical protein TQ37_04745 [Candidatus Synechococcus spongiarum 15L]|uniref:DNA repair protein RecO n=3 Tax=Candidatus Synechococcus spongiarum TaxID=431041 RepID=A0A1T1D491_9SYNE|nr:recombination protein O N-terminal domain-containing protein [Candidatus Synechococcus spongiarum]KKZ13076.1 MAG: hypothetical protein TQ37_04745 [Candidatus Synechococcus spongiarum 15L]OOV35620.1 hypothetical protein BV61_00160 [Candidatus Synechococcus spongiarum LMB bulk15M]OOV36050.1 hypothetical protein BV53_02270 [Candidatus Synechococcus spongiarum LMB bulk15N]
MAQARLVEVGLSLKASALGERDRLLTIVTPDEGITRLVVPGARRPGSRLVGAAPLRELRLLVSGGRSSLGRVTQLEVRQTFAGLGRRLESLAAAQLLAEITLLMVPQGNPAPTGVELLRLHWQRLDHLAPGEQTLRETVAIAVQGSMHLLASEGLALPTGWCCSDHSPLVPPLGHRDWRCSFFPADGFRRGRQPGAAMVLNASELALLQRLQRPALPRRRSDGDLAGPLPVWQRLLQLLRFWIGQHLQRQPRSLGFLEQLAAEALLT